MKTVKFMLGFLVTIGTLTTALWLAWLLLSPANFGYGLAYQTLDIDQHIQKYAPMNPVKTGFETTSASDHRHLFKAIVVAINHQGNGLADIQYSLPAGEQQTLLTNAEVVHLQDVANLVTAGKQVALVMLLVLVLGLSAHYWQTWLLPSGKQQLVHVGLVAAVPVGLMLVAGPLRFFYWLHVKIFPEDHQWFFYYQESLMATLMKAPDLFGFIAVIWLLLSMILYAGLNLVLRRIFVTLKARQIAESPA